MNRRNFLQGVISIGLGAAAASCVYAPDRRGPPAHAPAHGYRYRDPYGADLAFDAGLGLYIVVGRPRYYFWDGYYYRFYRDHWQWSPRLNGGWHDREYRRLPPGLRRRYPEREERGRGRDRR